MRKILCVLLALAPLAGLLTWPAEDLAPAAAAPRAAPADPGCAAAFRREALQHRIRGDWKSEIASLRAALEALPGDGGAQLGLATALAERGLDAEANNGFEALVDREPYRVVALEHLASLDRRARRRSDEIGRRTALALDGRRDLAALAELDTALIRADRIEEELDEPMTGGAASSPAASSATASSSSAPFRAVADPAWDRLRRATALESLGRRAEAEAEGLEALTLDPADEAIRRGAFGLAHGDEDLARWEAVLRRRATAMEADASTKSAGEGVELALAGVLARRGHIEEARERLQAAASQWPARASIHLVLGELLAASATRGDDAATELRRALELDPALLQGYAALGGLHLAQGSWTDAERVALAAIGFEPRYAPAYALLGAARLATGRIEEALTAFRSALFLDPRDVSGEGRIGLYRCLGLLGRKREGPVLLSTLLPIDEEALEREERGFAAEPGVAGRAAEGAPVRVSRRKALSFLFPEGAAGLRSRLDLPGGAAALRILADGSVIYQMTRKTED